MINCDSCCLKFPYSAMLCQRVKISNSADKVISPEKQKHLVSCTALKTLCWRAKLISAGVGICLCNLDHYTRKSTPVIGIFKVKSKSMII